MHTKHRYIRVFLFPNVPACPIASRRKVSKAVSKGGRSPGLTHFRLTHMLTDTKLRGLKPKTSVYRVADTKRAVHRSAHDRRTAVALRYRYRYRYAGKASMAALGEYPMMGLADAGAERDRMRVLVKGGANPCMSPASNALRGWSVRKPHSGRSRVNDEKTGKTFRTTMKFG